MKIKVRSPSFGEDTLDYTWDVEKGVGRIYKNKSYLLNKLEVVGARVMLIIHMKCCE
jgi:hypothetical protein